MDYKIIKPSSLLESMMGNLDVVKQMISMYLNEGRQDFQDLKTAVDNEDYVEIKSKAHHIKPTMEYIGASEIRLQFQELESLATSKAPTTQIHTHFHNLEREFNAAMQELTDYASTLS